MGPFPEDGNFGLLMTRSRPVGGSWVVIASNSQHRNIATSQHHGIAPAEFLEASATSQHRNIATSEDLRLQIFSIPSPQHRNIATSQHHGIVPAEFQEASATSQHRNIATSED